MQELKVQTIEREKCDEQNVDENIVQETKVVKSNLLRDELLKLDFSLVMDGLNLDDDYLIQNKYTEFNDQILSYAKCMNEDYEREMCADYIFDNISGYINKEKDARLLEEVKKLRNIMHETDTKLYELQEQTGYWKQYREEKDELIRKIDLINDCWDRINNKPSGCVFIPKIDVHVLLSWTEYISRNLEDVENLGDIDRDSIRTMRSWAHSSVECLKKYTGDQDADECD